MTILRRALLGVVGIWVTAVLLIMTLETRLVYPARNPAGENWKPAGLDFEEFECFSKDGTRVHGWVLPHPGPGPAVVFFHGNAEDVAEVGPGTGARLRQRLNATVLVFDYRGYGQTGGVPNERLVLEDSEAAVREFCRRQGLEPNQLVFYGRSLGGAVAVGTAARTGAGVLLLDRTFDSLPAAARSNYPWVPAERLMRNRFDSASRISTLDVPLLQSHFVDDEVVPVASGERLFAASPSEKKKFLRYPGGGHLVRLPNGWWQEAASFLDQHAPIRGASE